jgi:hypothetical protein
MYLVLSKSGGNAVDDSLIVDVLNQRQIGKAGCPDL